MAKNNPGDILTGDWNPIVGCDRYSAGCALCWWFDGIMPWQQRLGNLPKDMQVGDLRVLEKRFDAKKLRAKKGIVGVIQHGDLFWDKVPDEVIDRVLNMVDEVAAWRADRNRKMIIGDRPTEDTKYVLWSKRAKRMAEYMNRRYPDGVPEYLACGVSIENQSLADERLPHLLTIKGHRFVMIEPMLGPVDLTQYRDVHWVVVGSETGDEAKLPKDKIRTLNPDWVRSLRNFAVENGIPFFLKQLGKSHKKPERELDGRTWEEFPPGFVK